MRSRAFLSLLSSALLYGALAALVSLDADATVSADADALLGLDACPDPAKANYDFIVVGAGVGGGPVASRLVKAGFSVLLVDAGHDVTTVNSTIPFYFGRAIEDPASELNYSHSQYSLGAKFPRDGEWYPRARALGGSTIHNAMINHIGLTRKDFDAIAGMFNDSTWSYDHMRSYFTKLERNLYAEAGDANHGFDGWLTTSLNPTQIIVLPQFADNQLLDVVGTMGSFPPGVISDINAAETEAAFGAGVPSYTISEVHNRSYVHDFIRDTHAAAPKKLTLATDTLVTKIQLCKSKKTGKPQAYGVQLVPNAALPVASNFNGKKILVPKLVTAKYEVIISAGVFQTPQLLMLSGIGDKKQLTANGIQPIVNLPGVGANLQDHDELSVIWTLKQNHTLYNGCTVLYDGKDDPCLAEWSATGGQNLYSLGAALWMLQTNSTPGLTEPDIMVYWFPAYFAGFYHGFPEQIANVHNALTAITLKAHPSSRGTVQLTGPHPQDKLVINKHRFEGPGGPADIASLREGVKIARSVVAQTGIIDHVDAEVYPGPQAASDAQIEDHVLQRVFGHHACCTAKIGADGDPTAVLDNNFQVRGVGNLRVVDISSWANVPGWFVTTPTYMISEKAADILIAQYS
ncbi:Choline dehydrogenase [Mycena indigotica]|uniref:Choline dehydrogenase n=1 Tax=Mycena indigotica TaxID=2126181 RepID=A0A8H6S3I7_9AGAR|nr:Choline dehydrogenase [Mycena indigotica]KAF7292086.1 Choline dehydrogenase [Mycena indigotica]